MVGKRFSHSEKDQICSQDENDDIEVLGNATPVDISVHNVDVP